MIENTRDFDLSNPSEKAIFDAADGEGLVLWSRDINWGSVTERQLIAVVAGAEGPELICARAWPSVDGSGVNVRLDMKCSVDDACRPFLSKSPDASPRLEDLSSRDPYDASVAKLVGPRAGSLWRSADPNTAIFLLRFVSEDSQRIIAVATADRKQGSAGEADAELHVAVRAERFASWVHSTFGTHPAP